jgi:hypothetical protein
MEFCADNLKAGYSLKLTTPKIIIPFLRKQTSASYRTYPLNIVDGDKCYFFNKPKTKQRLNFSE